MSDRLLRPSLSRLLELNHVLARDPGAIAARFERAGLYRVQGDDAAAKDDYLEVLRRQPSHFEALNDFGSLVLKAGHREAARSLFDEAVRYQPDNPTGRVNLANLLLMLDEFEEARTHFEAALRIDPDHVHAHRGMGDALAELGDALGARVHRDRGFTRHYLTALPYRGDWAPIRVLLLVSAAGGNAPTAALLDEQLFQATVLVTEYYYAKGPLPAHDLIVNGVGDADLCAEGLDAAREMLRRIGRPVINHPLAVRKTGRAAIAERLRTAPHVIAPRMMKVPRHVLARSDAASVLARHGFGFPVLVRAEGFHSDRNFIRADNAEVLAAAADSLPGDDVWLIEPLDARDRDGMFRRFRVMIVDRKLYPLHLAIARHWKVHFANADVAASEQHRAQERAFLDDMAGFLGPRAMAALERINAVLDLDYGGIDFALDADGNVLFFEANAALVMVPLPADQQWAYRQAAFDTLRAAMRRMLRERATAASAASA
jgi:hypothetical protein